MSASPSNAILALDAGGTFFKSALVLPSGEIPPASRRSARVDSQGEAAGILAAHATLIRCALACATPAGLRIAAIGVSTPGPFDYANGASLMTHKFASIRGLNLRGAIESAVPEIRGVPWRFVHDAHAFILGEQQRGAARGHANAAGVTIGTGVGLGCVLDGKIRDNGAGGPLVSIYNKPCRDSVLEDYVSRRGIIRLFHARRELAGLAPDARIAALDVADIAALARAPEGGAESGAALAAFHEAGALLGETLRPILRELAITCLVTGGQISKSFDLLGPALRDALGDAGAGRRLVTAAQNPDDAALHGAALAAGNH